MKQEYKIVEYDHSYATAVADMWTRSGDSWGGFNIDMSPEAVRIEEETSVHINLYLAIVNEEVVGYCKIAKWTQDEGALYVASLNVRPDMHGKKIGKALVLKSVERTVELGWGRLDLHTWAGNTKAVPVYKKTGFFWEERDKEVYCVNYIPSVLHNPLVSDFFERADWYEDSKREIEVAPDGREDNKFTYFTYSWEKDGERLEMEYERRGRGLRRISRNDYDVEVIVENSELVFGREYEVRFSFRNRTGKPLDVEIAGAGDRNILFAYTCSKTIDESFETTAHFVVGAIEKDQSDWKTHPRVCAEITINGKTALFSIGVVPKFPVGIRYRAPESPVYNGVALKSYLDVESNLSEKADFSFKLESTNSVQFENPGVDCTLAAWERKSIEVPVTIGGASVYSRRVKASAALTGGTKIAFEREISGVFALPGGTYNGERIENKSDRSAIMGIGSTMARLSTERDSHLNGVYVDRQGYESSIRFFSFQLGKPYDDEFTRTPPISIETVEWENGRQLNARYAPAGYPHLDMMMHIRIEYSGLVRRWFSFRNTGDMPLPENLFLLERVRADMEDTVLPFGGQILETRTETSGEYWYWAGERLTENWVYTRRGDETIGIFWDQRADMNTGEWFLTVEHDLGALKPGESASSPVITTAVGVFSNWNECRNYALSTTNTPPPEEESLEISVNNHNPFVPRLYPVELIEHKQKFLDGAIGVGKSNAATAGQSQAFARDDSLKSACFNCEADNAEGIEIIDFDIDLVPVSYKRGRAIFPVGDGQVTIETGKRDGFDTIGVSNGLLSISSAPEYAPGLFSCSYRGEEWLDSGIPELKPRDWWNPWIGGCVLFPGELEARPLLREPATAKVVEQRDSKGNLWTGVMVGMEFEKHDELRGLGLDQYFMMLPGVPVLLVQAMIRQETGTHFQNWELAGNFCIRGSDATTDVVLEFVNHQHQHARLTSGHEDLEMNMESGIMATDKRRSGNLVFYADRSQTRLEAVTQKNSTMLCTFDKITCVNGEDKSVPAKFLIFSDSWLGEELLGDLRYIDLFSDRG
jgi:ribosomal protein S18 acetylase RimI-like enzyme